MANQDSTQGQLEERFKHYSIHQLADSMDGCAAEIIETFEKVFAVAHCGEVRAGSPDIKGDPVDILSKYTFSVITDMASDMLVVYKIKKICAEIMRRTNADIDQSGRTQ